MPATEDAAQAGGSTAVAPVPLGGRRGRGTSRAPGGERPRPGLPAGRPAPPALRCEEGTPPLGWEFLGAAATAAAWVMPCPCCLEGWVALVPDGRPYGYRVALALGCGGGCPPALVVWWHAWRLGELPADPPRGPTPRSRAHARAVVSAEIGSRLAGSAARRDPAGALRAAAFRVGRVLEPGGLAVDDVAGALLDAARALGLDPAAAGEVARRALLIDEADSFMRDGEELRGPVNSGHRRSLAFVIRNVEVGGEHQPRVFSTWCAMAIAGIGGLHGTVEDRSVVVELRRKLPAERVARFDKAARAVLAELARKAARWAADRGPALAGVEPAMPAGLNDRAADNSRPLLAIADAAGGGWPGEARAAALALFGADEGDSLATELLADVRGLFAAEDEARGKRVEKLSSTWMVGELARLEHRPWPEMPGTGRPLTARRLAVLLGRFGIAPRHEEGGNVYCRERFADAFGRYLPPPGAGDPSSLQESSNGAALGDRRTFSRANGPEASRMAENPRSVRVPEGTKVPWPGEDPPPWDYLDGWRFRLVAAADLEAARRQKPAKSRLAPRRSGVQKSIVARPQGCARRLFVRHRPGTSGINFAV